MTKVIKFPEPSEIDKQFLELERQKELIREQRRLIEERKK
jgi:hypothetical protein|tara:strand:- start:386 stop:505 length:120 start_codon:yes stop_codon:yes gene_type:complete